MSERDLREGQAGPGAENTSEEWDRLRALTESMTPSERAFMDVVSGIKPGGRLTFLGSKSAAILLSFRAALRASEAALAEEKRRADFLADEVERQVLMVEAARAEATRAERERCAKIADAYVGSMIAPLIRREASVGASGPEEAARPIHPTSLGDEMGSGSLRGRNCGEVATPASDVSPGIAAIRAPRPASEAALAERDAGWEKVLAMERMFSRDRHQEMEAALAEKDARVKFLEERWEASDTYKAITEALDRQTTAEAALESMTKERDARPSWGRVAEMVDAARAEATKAERERCAALFESNPEAGPYARLIAAAVRAPRQPEPEYAGQCATHRVPLGHLGCEHGPCPTCTPVPSPEPAREEPR